MERPYNPDLKNARFTNYLRQKGNIFLGYAAVLASGGVIGLGSANLATATILENNRQAHAAAVTRVEGSLEIGGGAVGAGIGLAFLLYRRR
jgi:hypothetical protein